MTEAEISNLQDKENYIQNEYNRDTYIEVGRFSANGLAANKVPDSIGAIAELRIRVIDHKNENWVALSEVSCEFIIFFYRIVSLLGLFLFLGLLCCSDCGCSSRCLRFCFSVKFKNSQNLFWTQNLFNVRIQ